MPEYLSMKIRRIISEEQITYRPPTVDYLKMVATPIDLSFDLYSLNRLSAEEMRWDAIQDKSGHRFRLNLA